MSSIPAAALKRKALGRGVQSLPRALNSTREERHERTLEGLTRFVGRGSVALDAEHPRAPLPVAAALEAADEARHVERVGDRGSRRDQVVGETGIAERAARSREMLAASGRRPGARTDIATAPGVDRSG